MIKFEDFFKLEFPEKTKVKFNINEDDINKPAWDYLREDEKEENQQAWMRMNAHKAEKNSNNNLDKYEYLMSFAQYYVLGNIYYAFGGLYKVIPKAEKIINGQAYDLILMDQFKEYRKRLIIKLSKSVGQSYARTFKNVVENLKPEIYQLTPAMVIDDFPGFNQIRLSHKDLQYIFNKQAPEWKRQLSSVKGIYCITDTSTGKIYIGSAYGDYAGIWQRWEQYANVNNLTGGNKFFNELKDIEKEYIIDKFQYSILEILDPGTSDNDVRLREEFWKKVFRSREFGMNKN